MQAVYGLRLSTIRDAYTLGEVADLVSWLPAGCALWQAVGGPAAMSVEGHELRAIEYRLRDLAWMEAGGKKAGRRPDPPKPIPFAHEKRAAESEMNRKAAAYLRRQQHAAGGR